LNRRAAPELIHSQKEIGIHRIRESALSQKRLAPQKVTVGGILELVPALRLIPEFYSMELQSETLAVF
jgi:hypothetical protein